MITKEQKDKLFELIHELLEEQSNIDYADSYEWETCSKAFDEKENELIAFVNTL
jgi:hypothetical protein